MFIFLWASYLLILGKNDGTYPFICENTILDLGNTIVICRNTIVICGNAIVICGNIIVICGNTIDVSNQENVAPVYFQSLSLD